MHLPTGGAAQQGVKTRAACSMRRRFFSPPEVPGIYDPQYDATFAATYFDERRRDAGEGLVQSPLATSPRPGRGVAHTLKS